MVVELFTGEEELRAFAELLRPEPTADGFESEERMVICGVTWERYLALDKALQELLESCVAIRSWQEARRVFRASFGRDR